jgi:hypothetical protein
MKMLCENSMDILLKKNYFSFILQITITSLLLPFLHIIIMIIIILIDYKLVIIPLTYILSVFFEEYFHTRVFITLYPNINLFFYKKYFSIFKYPLFTIAFGIQSLIQVSSLNQIYISFLGPINALCFNLLISPLVLLLGTQSFYTFLVLGTLIPLLSLIPKKHPIISDGYRILKIYKEKMIKFDRDLWINLLSVEKKIFASILSK